MARWRQEFDHARPLIVAQVRETARRSVLSLGVAASGARAAGRSLVHATPIEDSGWYAAAMVLAVVCGVAVVLM